MDFTRNTSLAPNPNHYNIDSVFDFNRRKSRGSSFGLGRELIKANEYIYSGGKA